MQHEGWTQDYVGVAPEVFLGRIVPQLARNAQVVRLAEGLPEPITV